MLESVVDAHVSTTLPYGLLITRILQYYSIDLSAYPSVEVFATYESKTFTSMGYVSVDNKWCKKECAKEIFDPFKISESVSNLVLPMFREFEEVKNWLKSIKEGLMVLQESTTKLM
ncbi:hypothetical protein FXO37_34577 [Capsicum annuum]|nr:hypothetical protein FXO37_34577 [Capsicum annuum]